MKRKRIERNAGEGKVRQGRNRMEGERRREKSREAERKKKGTEKEAVGKERMVGSSSTIFLFSLRSSDLGFRLNTGCS